MQGVLQKYLHRSVFKLIICAGYLFSSSLVFSQQILIEQNKGQWPSEVLYKTEIPGASVYLEGGVITYALYDLEQLDKIHHESHERYLDPTWSENDQLIDCHALKLKFINSNKKLNIVGEDKVETYLNYFKGNDPAKWASEVPLFQYLKYENIYNGMDLIFKSDNNSFKYEFHLKEGIDPTQIHFQYEGAEDLFLKEGNLHVVTSIGDLIEQRPVAWQITPTGKKMITCEFKIINDKITFVFPDGFDSSFPIVIDPVVVASTYSGGSVTTYGHTATFDLAGNIYSGGRSFGMGYPTTAGAYQVQFGGGVVDIAITKYNPDATSRIYSTYLGGTSGDYIHSMFVEPLTNELVIYGSSSSSDYPTTAGAFDQTYNNGTDIILTRFNSTGTALIGSTYVGGSYPDGYNSIIKNYGDGYRGEIILDQAGNIYVSSFSSSSDFPVSAGAFDPTYNGGQDGVVFCLNPDLTTLLWSTYLGGSDDDAAFAIKVDSNGNTYVAGCTSSPDFPISASAYQSSYQGGTYDGFICKLSNNGSIMQYSTYYGTSSYDGIFLVDLDQNNDVYIFGISEGVIAITPGKYGIPGSRQILAKFDSQLSSLIWQTTFGDGTISSSFSPTAFLVDNCNNIYAAGWGSTSGFFITPNAIQTNPGNFYVIVLGKDADSLIHATYYGKLGMGVGGDHVDGGTSRFDKKGIVYESVCTNSSSYPTTPGAVSSTNNSQSWDAAIFKIDFELTSVIAHATANPTTGCAPLSVNFTNQSINGLNYFWDFGDGTTSTVVNPNHTFLNQGFYNVMLVATDPNTCNVADTIYLPIEVTTAYEVNLGPDLSVCGEDSVLLVIDTGFNQYQWLLNGNLISENNPPFYATEPGEYTVIVSDTAGCTTSDAIVIEFIETPEAIFEFVLTPSCEGIELKTDNLSQNATSFQWMIDNMIFDDFNVVYILEGIENLNITLIAFNGNCIDTAVVENISYESSETILIPNIITPNGDGLNDCFKIIDTFQQDCIIVHIFNRWGNLVYDSSKNLRCWDGKNEDGDDLSEGVYFYILFFNKHQLNGVIHLIR